ncbi:MAG: UDP-N-acetylglucosamine--N-acetylmuramyl-(pentapeptide) pyrophosphoryl-undecaprenol N-acetylglucosamine transferase [Candidatus Curtissbacteria bacterium]
MKKIVIVGGHLTPALAVADALAEKKNYRVIFFGRKKATDGSDNLSAEFREVTKRDIPMVDIVSGRLTRKLTKYTIPSLLKIPLGFLLSFLYLIKYRPGTVIAFGGYLSTPVIFSAWLLGIDSITHEQAVTPGLANKINSLFVKKIFLSWPGAQKEFPGEKSEVIGTPQPALSKKSPGNEKLKSFVTKKGDLLVILGGSQGSHAINRFIFKNLDLFSSYNILHQLGMADYLGDHAKASTIRKNNYLAVDYISPEDLGAVLSGAKFIISRSGANTVWDLAALAKPAIFIPLPIAAGDEQTKNAQILETAGSAIILSQKDLSRQTMKKNLVRMEKDTKEFEKNAKIFQKTLPQNAAEKLINAI